MNIKKNFRILLLFSSWLISSCESEKPAQTFLLTAEVSPPNSGTIDYPSGPIQEGDIVELTAVPEPNWVFKQWEEDASGDTNPLTFIMDSDKNITGVFIKRDYPLTISVQGEGTVEEKVVENPAGREYPHGTRVILIPKPKEGWVFSNWSGDVAGATVPLQLTINGETQINATFVPKISTLVLGGSEDDVLSKVIKVSGGKYLLAGTTNSSDGIFEGLAKGGQDAFVIQLSSELVVDWVKVIGGSNDDYASTIIENNDGTYSLTGSFSSSDGDFSGKLKGNTDVFHIKLSQSGNTIWLNSFGTNNQDIFSKSMIQSKLGPYILLATSDGECCNGVPGNQIGGKDIVMIWVSENGGLLWARNYGSYKDDEASALVEASDHTIKVIGTQQPNGATDQEDLLVINMDPYGSQLGSSVYSGSGKDVPFDILESSNNLIVVGSSTSSDGDFFNNGMAHSNIFMMKLAFSGTGIGVQRVFGGSKDDRGLALIKSPSTNEFYVLGSSDSQDFDLDKKHIGASDLLLMKTDSYLNKKLFKTYGGAKDEGYFPNSFAGLKHKYIAASISLSHENGLILGGTTESNDQIFEGLNHGKKDLFVIKTDSEGNIN